MKRPPQTEAQLAARVVTWLKGEGWEVYEEAEWDVGRADIIATRERHDFGTELVVFETKKALSFDVIAQAARWCPHVTAAWVAVAQAAPSEGRKMAWRCLSLLGLRGLEVESLFPGEEGRVNPIIVRVASASMRRPNPELLAHLRPEHQTHAKAGTKAGGHVTPYRLMCESLARVAQERPGVNLRTALLGIEHPFKSVGNAIAKLVEADVAEYGMRIADDDVRGYQLFPVDTARAVLTENA